MQINFGQTISIMFETCCFYIRNENISWKNAFKITNMIIKNLVSLLIVSSILGVFLALPQSQKQSISGVMSSFVNNNMKTKENAKKNLVTTYFYHPK